MLETPNATGVVIHEKRFTYQADGLTLIADLGEHWEQHTGMPIPLGAIALRSDLPLQETIELHIQQSLAWAKANDAEAFALCQEYAQDLSPAVVRAHIDLYVNDFSYNVGEEGQKAVEFFLKAQSEFLKEQE